MNQKAHILGIQVRLIDAYMRVCTYMLIYIKYDSLSLLIPWHEDK